MKINYTYATKFIVSILGSVSTYLATPSMTWREGVILGITSVMVWLVPNTSNPTVILPPVVAPVPNTMTQSERTELEALRQEKRAA